MKKLNKKEKGFTLIELLAVIIILTVIALISVPMILTIIDKSRKSAFKDSAYGIMESARLYYVKNMLEDKNNIEDKIFSYDNEEQELEYSGTRPKGGIVIIKKDGTIEMSIHNEKWCAVTEGKNIKVINYNKETCQIDTPMIVEGESTEEIELGLDSAIPGKYYNIKNQKGSITCINLSDEKKEITNTSELKEGENCVECNMMYENKVITSLKRTFKIKKSKNTIDKMLENNLDVKTLDPDRNPRFVGINPNNYVSFNGELFRIIGVFEGEMKIMRNDFYQESKWDTSNSNNWTKPATINKLLNDTYWNTISIEYQEMVNQDHVWGIGQLNSNFTRYNSYNIENDMEWIGKVGLITPSDYGYASGNSNCTDNTNIYNEYVCRENNWIYNASIQLWTITTRDSTSAWRVGTSGLISTASVESGGIRPKPVLYLKSVVQIIGGTGTSTDPYILSL